MAEDIGGWWESFKRDNPKTALALEVAPVTGQVASGVDYYNDVNAGKTGQAIGDAVGLIPGYKMVKRGKELAEIPKWLSDNLMDAYRSGRISSKRLGEIVDELKAKGDEMKTGGYLSEVGASIQDLLDFEEGYKVAKESR